MPDSSLEERVKGLEQKAEHWFRRDDSTHRIESYNLMLNQDSVKKSLKSIGDHLEDFFGNLINLHVQTVVYDSQPTTSSGTANTFSETGAPIFLPVPTNVIAIYDTVIGLNGDTRNSFPKEIDQTVLTRHNALVDTVWKTRNDAITKIIEAIVGALKI